jgi:hypothetical protein
MAAGAKDFQQEFLIFAKNVSGKKLSNNHQIEKALFSVQYIVRK